jgi:oligopeptidase B
LPEEINECAKISPGLNACYGSTNFRFYVESPLHPSTALDYDFELDAYYGGRPGETWATKDYFMEKVFATSLDGTIIPVTLVGQATSDSVSPRPTVLVAYGSYGEINVPSYDPTLVPLLRRNFIIAYAHTRGGGELGAKWYEKGRGVNKPRAIDDLIACAEALTTQAAVTEPHLLGVRAFSAGAVIAAAAANVRPSLVSTLCLSNPFVDVFGAMSDPTLPLTEHERDEWGDLNTIAKYCPFTNVIGNSLPSTLVVGTLDDVNVPYWHASTYAIKRKQMLIEMKEDAVDDQLHLGETLLKIEESGGHNFHGCRLNVASLECAFLISELKTEANCDHNGRASMLGTLWEMIK